MSGRATAAPQNLQPELFLGCRLEPGLQTARVSAGYQQKAAAAPVSVTGRVRVRAPQWTSNRTLLFCGRVKSLCCVQGHSDLQVVRLLEANNKQMQQPGRVSDFFSTETVVGVPERTTIKVSLRCDNRNKKHCEPLRQQ